MRPVLSFVLIAAFCAACLTVAALALGPPPMGLAPGQDKVQHFIAFLVLTILGVAAFRKTSVLAPAAGLFVGGIAIELLQGLSLFNRSPSLGDVAADGAGVAVGLVIAVTAQAAWGFLRWPNDRDRSDT